MGIFNLIIMIEQYSSYLITTDNWFFAPDGQQYKSVWGKVSIVPDSFLGIKTNTRSSNWYAKIGSEQNHVIVAGCQIHYAVKSGTKPNTEDYPQDHLHEGEFKKTTLMCNIYIAE